MFRAGYERLAEIDFDNTLDNILINTNRAQHSSYWHNLALSVLAKQQPEYVSSSITLVSGAFNNLSSKKALNDLSISLNPAATAQHALEKLQLSRGADANVSLLENALGRWILEDPQSTLAFVQSEIIDDIHREELTIDLLTQWLEHDPASANPAVESILNEKLDSDPDAYLDLVDVYIEQVANTNPESALQWLQSQNSELLRDSLFDAVLQPWLQQDRTSALNYLTSLDEQSATHLVPLAIPVVANSLNGNSSSLEAAIDWSDQLSESLQVNTRHRLISAWIDNHPRQGVDWLLQQANTGQSQDILLPAAQALARRDATAAERLHAGLSSDVQLALTDSVIVALASHGEDRALAWLQNQTDVHVINRGRSLVSQLF